MSEHASKASLEAMRENDAHTQKTNSHDHVPGDDAAHAHSPAAHLHDDHKTHTNNEAGGSRTGELRQPQMDRVRRHDEPNQQRGK